VALAISLAVCLTSAAQAQRGRGGFGGGMMTTTALLTNPGVQKEIGLTPDQIKKITDVTKEIRDKHQDERAALRDLQGDERREKTQALNKTVADETKAGLKGVLKPDQEKRLNQIFLQTRGVSAFADADVQKKLKLSDDQKEKLKTIADDSQKDLAEIFQGLRGADAEARQEAMKKIAAIRKEAMDKAKDVLSADQKKDWEDMTGKPFTVQFQGRGGRGRRGAGQN
jgi:hypothetical protein